MICPNCKQYMDFFEEELSITIHYVRNDMDSFDAYITEIISNGITCPHCGEELKIDLKIGNVYLMEDAEEKDEEKETRRIL